MTVPATAIGSHGRTRHSGTSSCASRSSSAAVVGGVIVGQAAMAPRRRAPHPCRAAARDCDVEEALLRLTLLGLGAALLFEQISYTVGTHDGPFTAHVAHVPELRRRRGAAPDRESSLFIGLLIWLLRAGLMRTLDLPGSAISKTFVVFCGATRGGLRRRRRRTRRRFQHLAVGDASVAPARGQLLPDGRPAEERRRSSVRHVG